MSSIYILCPDSNDKHGGIKKLYRHVDVLNHGGFSAYVLHENKGFRCDWFENVTQIAYASEVEVEQSDYLVIPEVYGSNIAEIFKGVKKVIFNQNAYYSFKNYSLNSNDLITPYTNEDLEAVLVVSEDNKQYLQYIFPELKVFRIHNGIDISKFAYTNKKNKLISLMLNKQLEDVTQLINILKFRGIFKEFNVKFIANKNEVEVASILQESLLFLWFTYQEGWPLPPAEAMACGSIVIGYHGFAGKECLNPEFSYPIAPGDIITFARTVEEVIQLYKTSPHILEGKAKQAYQFIETNHSLMKEQEDIISSWNEIFKLSKQNSAVAFINNSKNNNIEIKDNKIKRGTKLSSFKSYPLSFQPNFSIIFPVFNTPKAYLKAAIESVLNQVYPHWELCVTDDASTEAHIRKTLEEYSQIDSRIKVVFRAENGHISRASNSAIEIATGEFIALLDHDDLLTPDALSEVALLLNQHPDADMIYSDEDKVDDNNQFIFPTYKQDWCPDSFLSRMYTCHLGVYRRSLVNKIGGFRVGYEGSQDYDLVLRLTEKTKKIFHIPKILYHWRLHAGSTSASTTAKSYAYEAAVKALTDALHRRGEKGIIFPDSKIPGYYHVRYEIDNQNLVSILIVTKDFCSNLNQCLESIFAETLYPNYEVIVIHNGSIKSETQEIINQWRVQQPHRFKYYFYNIPFNYSRLNNYAVTKAQGDYLLFLNNDTQILQGDWLNAMVEQAQRKSIGAVGALLTYPDNSIQHIGLVLGLGKIASPIYKGLTRITEDHAMTSILLINNISVVTGACLMCRRDVFAAIDGFDEVLPILYNDVDICLKMMAKGYHNVYLPHVRLIHQELRSWQVKISKEENLQLEEAAVNLMRQKWGKSLEHDSCFSPQIIKKINKNINFNIQMENQEIAEYQSKPLVSVCIPTYNGEEFINETISSVLLQTYYNLEIIVSDDNSSDRTIDIVRSFQQNNSLINIYIFQHECYGLADNWNFCISQAQGKYIKFLMQDDLLEPDCIEEMVKLAEQDDEIGLVFSPRDIIISKSAESDTTSQFVYEGCKDLHKAWSKLKPIQSSQDLLADHKFLDEPPLNKIGEPSTVLIKKDVFERLGNFDPQLKQLIDLDMWFRIIGNYKIGFVNKTLSYFRIHPRQASRTNITNGESSKDSQRFYTKMLSSSEYSFLTAAHKHVISNRLAHIQNWQLQLQQLTEENLCSVTYPVIDLVEQKTDRPLWSVMIPTYNPNLEYLEKTLRSVLEQDLGCEEMHVEVVDDRSTQNDPEELVERVGQGRVSFYRHPKNLGLIGNWNACINRARGHWVHILHQDDLVKPGFYNRLQTAFEQEPTVGAAFCRYFYMDEKGYEQALSPLERETPGVIPNWIERIAVSQRIECPSIVVKREVYEKLGGYCREVHYAADWEMWKRIAAHYSVWYEPELLASYRSHSFSETSRLTKSGANIADTRKAIKISQSYLPVTIAAELSYQARENCAFKALNVARQMLSKGDMDAAIAQIREGIKSSQSSNTIISMLELVQEVVSNSHQHNLLPLDALNLFLPAFQEPLQEQQAIALVESLNLRDNSLVIFPDWNLSEDLIYEDLANVISNLMNYPDCDRTTLLMDRGNLTEEEATLFISGVVMNLVMETDLDVADELEISSIGQLNEMQWKALLPRINARIALEHENQQAIARSQIESIPTYEISSLGELTNILT